MSKSEHYRTSNKGNGVKYGRHESASPEDFTHDLSPTEVPQDRDHYEKDENNHVRRKQRRRGIPDQKIDAAIKFGNCSMAKGDNRYKFDHDGIRVVVEIDQMWEIPGITSTIITVIDRK